MTDQSFMIPPASSPDAIKMKRALAQALVAKGTDTSPIQSPWQGVARVSQALLGGYQNAMADQDDKARQAQIMSIMGGGASSPAATPPVALDGSGAPAGGMTLPAAANAPATAAAAPEASTGPDDKPVVPTGKMPSMAMAGMGAPGSFNMNTDYLPRLAQIESGNNPNAVNKASGAAGLFQFIPSTWKQYAPSPDASPTDPQAATAAVSALTADNRAALAKALGHDPNPGELYLAHQQGAGGAIKLLTNPNARAGDIVGDRAVSLNGGSPDMPAGAFAQQWINKFNGTSSAQLPAAAAAPAAPVKPFVPSAADGSFWGSSYEDDSPQAAVGKALNPTMAFNGATSPGSMSPLPPGIAPPQAAPAKAAAPDSASAAQNFVRQQTAAAQSQGQTLLSQAQSMRQRATALMAMGETGSANLLMQQAVQTETAARNALGTRWSTTPAGKVIGIKPDGTMNTVDLSDNEKATRMKFADGPNGFQIAVDPTDPSGEAIQTKLPNGAKPPQSIQEYQWLKAHPEDAAAFRASQPGVVIGRGGQLVNKVTGDVLAKNDGGGTAALDPELINSAATRIFNGEKGVLTGFGRGAQGGELIAAIQKRVAQITNDPELAAAARKAPEREIQNNGYDAEAEKARSRRVGGIVGQNEVFGRTAANAVNLAVDASDAVPRSDFVPINQLEQMWNKNTGSEEQMRFAAANNTLVNEYAKATSGGGATTEGQREHAREMLSPVMSQKQYRAVVGMMVQEMRAAHQAGLDSLQHGSDFNITMPPPRTGSAAPTAPLQSGETRVIAPGITIKRLP